MSLSQHTRFLRTAVASATLVIGLAACGGWSSRSPDAALVPDKAGFYAARDGELFMRLDGSPEWEAKTWGERQTLDNPVEFVIYDPTLASAGSQAVQLVRVGWVRSDIDPSGAILPAQGSRWQPFDDPEAAIPLRITHVAARGDVLRLTPDRPLADGLYSLRLRTRQGAKHARFGLQWPRVDQRVYASTNCLDHYVGSSQPLRRCTDQTAELLARGLELHLVQPEQTSVNGTNALVIRGVVINKTDRPKPVPMLEAQLRGAGGSVLKRWQFAIDQSELPQRGSAPFQTTVMSPPPQVQDVHIRVLPMPVVREAHR